MPRLPRLREDDFPPPGTVFLAPTADGRLAAGRVLRRAFEGGAPAALIVASPWLGDAPPPLDLPELRQTLILNHHRWTNHPERLWVFDTMPDDFRILGQIDLDPEAAAETSDTFGGWHSVPIQALKQWRWDHDRAALFEDEARETAAEAEHQRKRAAAREDYLKSLTLEALVDRKWFPNWDDDPHRPTAACRGLMTHLVHQLRAEPNLTRTFARRLLQESVKAVNRLDAEQHGIATLEREDLFEAYEQILCAARFPQLIDQIDRWREW